MKSIRRNTLMILIIVVTSLFIGCMYGAVRVTKFNDIKKGMTKQEIISQLGSSITTSLIMGDIECLNFSTWETIGDTFKGRTTPYFVMMKNGVVDEWGKNDINIEIEQAEKEGTEMFKRAGIKKIEIRLIKFIDWQGNTPRGGEQLFKEEANRVIKNIEQNSYSVKLGDIINVAFHTACVYGCGKNNDHYSYYLAVKPLLKSLQIKNVQDRDAILLLVLPKIEYLYTSPAGYTSPYSDPRAHTLPPYYGKLQGLYTEKNVIVFLKVIYYIFDTKSKKLIYTDSISGKRENNYMEQRSRASPGQIFSWNFTESEDIFLQRIFGNIYFPDLNRIK